MRIRSAALLLGVVPFLVVMFLACSKPEGPPATSSAPAPAPGEQSAAQPAGDKTAARKEEKISTRKADAFTATRPTAPKAVVVPAGTVLTVRLGQSVGSKISQTGQSFTATLAQPIQVDGAVAVPAGTEATGTVAEAVPLGRFKGGAKLVLRLDTLNVSGKQYPISTSAIARSAKGKGKRTATMVGGGAGVGALIGGLAGGGKGAAIGAIAGAGAGTAGSAFTGNKDIVLAAESTLSFKLKEPLQIE
ncbi:MAG: hypothetical protein ACE14M_09660 [Terriglobales bacterium]